MLRNAQQRFLLLSCTTTPGANSYGTMRGYSRRFPEVLRGRKRHDIGGVSRSVPREGRRFRAFVGLKKVLEDMTLQGLRQPLQRQVIPRSSRHVIKVRYRIPLMVRFLTYSTPFEVTSFATTKKTSAFNLSWYTTLLGIGGPAVASSEAWARRTGATLLQILRLADLPVSCNNKVNPYHDGRVPKVIAPRPSESMQA